MNNNNREYGKIMQKKSNQRKLPQAEPADVKNFL